MNTDTLVSLYTSIFKPSVFHSSGPFLRDNNIDLCVVDACDNPKEMYYTLYESLPRLSENGIIFIKNIVKDSKISTATAQLINTLAPYKHTISFDIINTKPYGVLAIYPPKKSIYLPSVDGIIDTLTKDIVDVRNYWTNTTIMEWFDVPWLVESLCTKPYGSAVDIVYTLADAPSKDDNENLKLSLRSVSKNLRNIKNIWVVTHNPPPWLTGVNIIDTPDTFNNCKDANIINKVLSACKHEGVSDRFIFMSDDNIVNTEIPADRLYPVYNPSGIRDFEAVKDKNRWHIRMINTLHMINSRGGDVRVNWDSHVPQPIDKHKFMEVMSTMPYDTIPGVCINTAYFGIKHEPPIINQNMVKDTFESDNVVDINPTKPYIGFNDKGYKSGLREVLMEKFSDKCIYEK